MATYNITADSVPDYDNWGPDDYWSCTDWINWHKALKAKFGKVKADETWLHAWNEQDSFEHAFNWCKYAGDFNSYAKSENLNVSHLLADLINGVTSVGENAITTATTTSKILKYLIPVAVVLVALGVLFYFGRRYKII